MVEGLVNIYKEDIIGLNFLATPDQMISQLLKNSPLGILILNNDFEIIECNNAASGYLSLDVNDKVRSIDKYEGDAIKEIMDLIGAVRLDKASREITIKVISEGRAQYLHISVSILMDSRYRSSGYSILITNIGDMSNSIYSNILNEHMMEYIRMRAVALADDLRLQCISGQFSRDGILADANMISDTMRFVDTYLGMGGTGEVWCNLQKIVDDAYRFFKDNDSESRIEIKYKLNGIEMMCNEDLRTMFYNLFKYSRLSGAKNVNISVQIRDGNLALTYVDDGFGIPKSKKNRITSEDQSILGPEIFLVGKYLGMHNFKYRETGVKGMDMQIQVPPSKYSINFN